MEYDLSRSTTGARLHQKMRGKGDSAMPAPAIWSIPYPRNLFFTGRDEVLSQLHHALQTNTAVALSHMQGISGLGGIGKTQTALEYAYRYQSNYTEVFWMQADTVTALNYST